MSSRNLFIGFGIIIICVIVAIIIGFNGEGPGPDGEPVTPNNVGDALQLRNQSIALVENQRSREAIPVLQKLIDQFPNEDRFARQNLLVAIAILLDVENAAANPEKFSEQFDLAQTQFEKLDGMDVRSVEIEILRSRVAKFAGRTSDQIKACEQAGTINPDEAFIWYELFEALNEASSNDAPQADSRGTRAEDAIAKCYQTAPENVWAIIQYLQILSTDENADLLPVLKKLKQILTPFAAGIKQRSRIDPLEFLQQAIDAVTENNWSLAKRNIRLISNVLRPEDLTQSDRARLTPNSLEFVSMEMSNGLKKYAATTGFNMDAQIPVEFERQPIELPELSGEVLQCEFADLNLDGITDLVVLTNEQLLIAEFADQNWKRIFTKENTNSAIGFALADLDQDSDPDRPSQIEGAVCSLADLEIVLFGTNGVEILENQMSDAATLKPRPFEPELAETIQSTRTVLPADFDLDGDLDLAIADDTGKIRMLANHQNFQFKDISDRSQLPQADGPWIQAIAVDLDRDVDVDVVFLNKRLLGYLENLRHGAMRWQPIDLPGTGLSSVDGEFSDIDLTDIDANASWDLIVCQNQEVKLLTSNTTSPGGIKFGTAESLGIQDVHRVSLWDFDNDGFDDLTVYSSEDRQAKIMRRSGTTSFSSDEIVTSVDSLDHPGAIEDIDNDGDLDWLTWDADSIVWHRNEGGNKNGFLRITLLGQQAKGNQAAASGRVNHYGWGSLLELKSGPRYQARVASRQTTHFGLGTQKTADVLRVVWPNGIPQNVIAPKRDSYICEELKLKGSCPYLYTWNGKRFEFYTDLLWASPVGLQFAEGVLAPTRPWEYLLVSGDRLQPRNGAYEIQITEELWEAAYFDQVELIAIDHPASVDVYSNEKVASAETPEFGLHLANEPRMPIRAVDSNGRDVLPWIVAHDDVYAKLYDRKFFQGVTNEHFLELDLGELSRPNEVKLFLTGWVYPSDTSINVALGQNQTAPKPRPPFLQVPDENGQWVTVNPSMGFPGGKTKTIVVDLSNTFLTDDYRVRIGTSMELYWDHIFFTVGEKLDASDAKLVRKTSLELESADLHYRGVSRMLYHPKNGPESFDYDVVDPNPAWPAMTGDFTAFGDVADLLREEDDRSVTMGAGDEITIRFRPPTKPLPEGWKRDFILHNVGYDKDADLNTVYGRSSFPWPTRTNPINPSVQLDGDSFGPVEEEPLPQWNRQQPARRFWTTIRDSDAGNRE